MPRTAVRLAAILVPLLLAGGATAALAQGAGRGHVFTCVNGAGRTLTSDRLIAECMDREQRVLARDGTLIRIVPPSLTAEERAEKEARDRRAAAEKEAKAEAVRRDRLLMQRFPNETEHQKARNAALEDVRAAQKASEARIADLARERKPLIEEAEFYKGKALPAKLKQQLDANDAAVGAQRDVQTTQQAELERVAKRFDDELALLKKLWAGAAPGSIVAAAEPMVDKAGKPVKAAPATHSR
jgi:hypothetical protein